MTETNGRAVRGAILPTWSIVAAGMLLLGGGLVALRLFSRPGSPSIFFQLLVGTFLACFLAVWFLAVVYVNRDARRRGMNATLWTLLVIFVPNVIGFILYFLLRPPVPVRCPACGASVRAESKFCPACGRSLQSGCPACGQVIATADAYCAACGRALRA